MLEPPFLLDCFGVLSTHLPEATLHILPDLRRRDAQLRRNRALCDAAHLQLDDAAAALLCRYALPVLFSHWLPSGTTPAA